MAYFGNASRQLLESLQGVRRIHQDLRKVRVGNKDYVWSPWQQQIGRFLSGFPRKSAILSRACKNCQFFFCFYTECGNKVAWSKDVLRYHLLRKYSVSKKNENS